MFSRDVVMSVEMPAFCDAKVASLLAKKAITTVEDDSVGFIFSSQKIWENIRPSSI
jgi:hypothetical protein